MIIFTGFLFHLRMSEIMMVTHQSSVFRAWHQIYVLCALGCGVGVNGGARVAETVMVNCIGWRERNSPIVLFSARSLE